MASEELIEKVRKEFKFLEPRVLAVLLFGSQVRGDITRGDVDICVVAPGQDKIQLLFEIFSSVDVFGKGYDVFVFEELPLYMKFEVLKNHEVVFSRSLSELYEYFYLYRKLMDDYQQRERKARIPCKS
jgi:hypothetical protein